MTESAALRGVWIATVLAAATARVMAAPTPEQSCEAGKDLAAGKYVACRQAAEKNLVLSGDAAKYATAIGKCDAALLGKWQKLEATAAAHGAACPSTGDQAAVQNFLTASADAVATALHTPPLLIDVESCNADLTTCNADLTSCNAKMGTCNAGTAVAGDVLTGKTFSGAAGLGVTGTMANNGAVAITPGTSNQPIAAGYHNGAGYCAGDANLAAGNIRSGATIFGVSGDSNVVNTSSGTAAAGDLLSGKVAWVTGTQLTGAMPNNGAVTITPGTSAQAIPAGYHNGAGSVAGDTDLLSANIRSGVSIFGVSGSPAVVNTSAATATAADMLSGATAYVNGSLVSGSAAPGGNVAGANGLRIFTIPDALYSGGKTATASDTNLAASNILSGVSIFGVTGTVAPGQRLKTDQTQCDQGAGTLGACPGSPVGQDGALGKGLARSYTDNSDGTITDNRTGLMWEKLDDNNTGGIHDIDNSYTWYTAFTSKIATLNSGNFAGYNDWRLPNVNELRSLTDFGRYGPAIDPAFNTGCAAGCTVTSCSCTASNYYWTATTYQNGASLAWSVLFNDGYGGVSGKSSSNSVRAVRGG